MYKYIGDSILNASFTVQVPKPLDNRTVVNNIHELYSIPAAYAYLGMTVANIDNGNIYMLVDKTKINQKAGWKASYESIQIITCSYQEYKEWELNTNELFQPIDDSKEYLHQDTYYYIYEDSLPLSEINQEYVKRSDWLELLNQVATKASNDAVININRTLALIVTDYATKLFIIDGYAPLSMFDLQNAESFISTNFFTKTEALEKFVKFSDLSGDDPGEGDFIFVTASRYETDQEALAQYQADLAEELTHFLRVGDDGELGNVVISQIKSPVVNDEQLVVNVTPEGFKVGDDRFAMLSDVPPHVTLTKEQYDTLVENDEVDPDTYYHIVGDDDTYVLQSELQSNYYTKTGVESYVAGKTYSKQEVDDIIDALSFYTQEQADNKYVTKTSLETTLEDYVTIAMLGGDDVEGQFIFVKQSEFTTYKEALDTQREQDLQNIADTYLQKDSDITVTSVISTLITDGTNSLTIGDILEFNNKELAFKEDVPKLVTLTKAEYQALVENDEVDEDVYYHITDDTDTYVLASLLSDYYTKAGIESYIAGRTYTKGEVDNLIARLSGYYTKDDIDDLFVSNNALLETLEGYVTIAMLGGDDMEGQFIFVKASDYTEDQQALATLREQDLQQIESDYVKKDSDASLNSLETATIKNGLNTLSLTDVLKLNNKKLALDEDVPVIRVVSLTEYESLTKDPNVYYFVYNTNANLAFVTAEELENYYTKPLIDSKLVAINQYSEFIKSDLFVLMSIKFNVEKILMERIADNQYYIARASGQHIDITEYAPDLSVLTTTGTGLVSFLRHLITNDTELGNDVLTITLSYNDATVTMTESGLSTDNPSTVSVQLVTFLRQATGIATGDIKLSDLDNMILDMRVAKDTVYVDYKVAVKVQQS